mmetsp:Transcript_4071/g.14249  ORF Transcript_4071/g.14249 Transcript_4071/m.14249 type:complete len:245 (+) Transcript_4071:76-810(+)
MMWVPESVSMISDSWPIASANEASSNGFCIWPRPKLPRSPPCLHDEQSDRCLARRENATRTSLEDTISARSLVSSARAAAGLSVTSALVRRETGFREFVCLQSKWATRTDSFFATTGVRRMMWTPESVSMISEISPTSNANVASSNGFCIAPRPNAPKSPDCANEPQSLRFFAVAANLPAGSLDAKIDSRQAFISFFASSSDMVRAWFVRRDTGLREPVCFSSRWLHRTWLIARASRSRDCEKC